MLNNFLAGLPEDKKTAADMYEKAALLGEQGAEEEAKRLRKDILKTGKYHCSFLIGEGGAEEELYCN